MDEGRLGEALKTRLLLCILICGLAQAGEDEPAVQASGLRVATPNPIQDKTLWPSGTTLSLLVTAPSMRFIQFDSNDSTITRFVDDKGTDFQMKPPPGTLLTQIGFNLFPKFSKDGKLCSIEITSPHLPARGATQIKLNGLITMLCASSQKEHSQPNVQLVNGGKIHAPNLELTLDAVGTPQVGDEPFSLTLSSRKELDEVAEIRFYKSDGSEIKSRRTGTSKMAIFGTMKVDWNFNLAEKVDAATVKMILWSDLQKKRIPFDLKVDLGLDEPKK